MSGWTMSNGPPLTPSNPNISWNPIANNLPFRKASYVAAELPNALETAAECTGSHGALLLSVVGHRIPTPFQRSGNSQNKCFAIS
jgi:hypothetical protein